MLAMRLLITLVSIFLFPTVVRAHHSFSEYDQKRTIEIAGTLSEVAWQNPHVRLKVQSLEAGKVVTWVIECHSVGILSRSNVDPKALSTGSIIEPASRDRNVS
jgi:hypothetical protein